MKINKPDDYDHQVMRLKMKRLEKLVQSLDSELITYLIDYSAEELERRSIQLEETHWNNIERNKRGYEQNKAFIIRRIRTRL